MWRLPNSDLIQGNSAGSMNGDGSRKLLLHSTEGSSIAGAIGAYRANNSWPHFTVDCRRRQVAQHLDPFVAARSLRNDPGGADQTNRDGSIHVQIEIVGFAGTPESLGTTDDLAWFGQKVVKPICDAGRIPILSSVTWVRYPNSYGKQASQRLSPDEWDVYSGVLGHQHAPDNSHGDPGLIDIHEILNAARGVIREDDMPSIEEINAAAKAGQLDDFFKRGGAVLRDVTKLSTQAQVSGLGALIRGLDDIDEAALAAALAPLITSQTQSLSDTDLAAIATAVNDEQHRRSAG
jgi:hypothetical protein